MRYCQVCPILQIDFNLKGQQSANPLPNHVYWFWYELFLAKYDNKPFPICTMHHITANNCPFYFK